MQDDLPLKSKLFIPQIRSDLVHRPRLVSQLNAGVQHALTLISAPPGFGKTTALAEWAAGNPLPVAWVSLDREDNDPARFLAYLLFALDQYHLAGGENAALRQSIETLPPRMVVERLLRSLEVDPGAFAVVLDDYHVIAAQPIHDCMAFLLDHLPPQMHLVIATRADPPIPLGRLRARGELTELRADELRFTAEETASFLERVSGVSFTADEISLLEARTEGWIAGLQLAALSMHGRKDVHAFIQAFSGTHRFILDYLVEEVLNRQPEDIQVFLLRTSILERLTAPLCDVLLLTPHSPAPPVTHRTCGAAQVCTRGKCAPGAGVRAGASDREQRTVNGSDSLFTDHGSQSSQSILDYLDRSNLFLVPLDDDRQWYRYHHLFAELLQAQLQQRFPDLIPALHLRAAGWFERQGLLSDAVQHALRAGDDERAATLLELHGQERWSFSDLAFLRLIAQLPLEFLQSHPKLGFYDAWMLITLGQLDAAGDLLHQLIQNTQEDQNDPEVQGIRGFIQLLFTYIAALSGKPVPIELPEPAVLEIVPEHFLAMRNSADVVYAMLRAFRGEFELAGEILLNTVRRDLAAGGTTATPISIALFARLRTLQGRLHEAAGLCRKYLQVVRDRGSWQFYLAGDLNIVLGEVLREWNDLDEAEREIREGMRANEPWNMPQGTAVGMIALAHLYQARGDSAAAEVTLDEAERLVGGSTLTPDLTSELRTLRLSFKLAKGDLAGLEGWADGLPAGAKTDYRWELDFIVLSRLMVLQGDFAEAEQLLKQLSQQAGAGQRVLRQVKIDLIRAQALMAQKKLPGALELLESCLTRAEPEGFMRTFLDEGEPVRELLLIYLRSPSPVHRAYANQLLDAFPTSPPSRPAAASQTGLAEPLTPREAEVLRLICAGRSNQEIAGQLVITLNTVKRHNNSIFGKLGVINRSQAILRAQQLGLV